MSLLVCSEIDAVLRCSLLFASNDGFPFGVFGCCFKLLVLLMIVMSPNAAGGLHPPLLQSLDSLSAPYFNNDTRK